MADSKALLRHLTSRRARRGALVFAFWAMLLMLV